MKNRRGGCGDEGALGGGGDLLCKVRDAYQSQKH